MTTPTKAENPWEKNAFFYCQESIQLFSLSEMLRPVEQVTNLPYSNHKLRFAKLAVVVFVGDNTNEGGDVTGGVLQSRGSKAKDDKYQSCVKENEIILAPAFRASCRMDSGSL